MGLEVTRILARAKGSFQSRKMKKSTLGMSSRRSQYRTLEEPISSYSSSRHWWGSLILDAVGGGHAVLPLASCRLAIPPAVA